MSEKKREASIMFEEIKLTPKAVERCLREFPGIVDAQKDVLTKPYAKIYAVGCGDSLYAPQCAQLAFKKNTGLEFEVLEAHEFCTYHVDDMPKNSLVFVASNGGAAARTAECAHIARKRGATVVAITGNPKSRLAVSSDHVISYVAERLGHVPGNVSFVMLLTMFYVISAKMGRWSGYLSAEGEQQVYDSIAQCGVLIGKMVEQCNDQIHDIMKAWKDKDRFYCMGAGPNNAMAEFGGAKFMEASSIDGIHQQLEEFAHQQYWVSNMNPDTNYFVFLPAGRCQRRGVEIFRELNFLGTGNVCITTQGYNPELEQLAQHLVVIPGQVDENYTPLINSAVISLCAYHQAEMLDGQTTHFRCEEQEPEHYTTIHWSRFSPEVADKDIEMPEESKRTVAGLSFEK